jgi:hypothetical protein
MAWRHSGYSRGAHRPAIQKGSAMTPLSNQLSAILREHALSIEDHRELDSRGHGASDPALSRSLAWGWQVTVDSESMHVTAQAKPVALSRTEALSSAEELFDRLAALLPGLSYCSVAAWSVYDRVNRVVVGWVGSVSITAGWSSHGSGGPPE